MPLVTLGGVRESIVSFMAMDDLWRRRVPEHKGWQISVVWFLPAVDVLVGALVALAVGAGGLLLATLQDHLDTLGPGCHRCHRPCRSSFLPTGDANHLGRRHDSRLD